MTDRQSSFESVFDCAIVGGGPAGLTCAIFLGRYRRRVVLLDNGQPRNAAARGIHGFLGQHDIKPAVLRDRGRKEAASVGVELVDTTVRTIQKVGDSFQVQTELGTLRARRVVLAYGLRDIMPDIPGVDRFYGKSILHCPDCDGYEVTGRRVGVIGSGKRVVGLSLKLLQWTEALTIFLHGAERDFSPEEMSKVLAEGIKIREERISTLVGNDDKLEAVILATGERVDLDALFFSLGVERTTVLAEDLGCTIDTDGPCLLVDDYKQTNVEGVYAIGDLVPGSQLAITSAADGAIAAIAINKTLIPPARKV